MRNTGWYIPYWRKPTNKKKGKAEKNNGAANAPTEEVWRSDEQLESVRQRWIERYRRTARACGALGLSVGSNRTEVQARYDTLRERGGATRDMEDAYRYLSRVLPPPERRKKRPQGPEWSDAPARASLSVFGAQETVVSTGDSGEAVVAVDLYVVDVEVDAQPGDDIEAEANDDTDELSDLEG
jgi:hypothetical protein